MSSELTMQQEADVKEMNIHQKMLAIQGEVTGVTKDTTVAFRSANYKGVSHDAVTVAVRGAALKYGVLISPSVTRWEDLGTRFNVEVTTRFTNADDPADYIEVISVGQGMDTQDKGSGKAQSYAKKYGLMLAFQLETRDGDESRVGDPVDVQWEPDLDFLNTLIENSGKDKSKVLSVLKLDKIEDINKTQFARLVRQLSPKTK